MSHDTPNPYESQSMVEQLEMLFAPWNRTDAPGLIVGVAKGGTTVYRRGFGMASLETFVANSPKTRMRIASMSKHFTSLLALLLAEDGKLDLDVPVRTYIPEMTGPGGDPSLRLLMQHRGGSRCYLNLGVLSHGMAVPPMGAMLASQVRQTGCNFACGETAIYNNGGYQLVSIAIERAGGAPFEAQMKQRLFAPIGMFDTDSIQTDYDITPGAATMHVPLPDGGWRRGLLPLLENRGDGAIVSTVDDLLRWTAHLRSRDRFGSPASWAALVTPPVFPDGSIGTYALGLMLRKYRGLRTLHHAGGAIGGSSQMLTFPDNGVDIVILANGAPGANPVKLAEQVADIVLIGQLDNTTARTVDAVDYEMLLGDWWSPETGMLYSFINERGVLTLGMCGDEQGAPLKPLPDGRLIKTADGIGQIEVDSRDTAHGDNLKIRFGGQWAVYSKLPRESVEVAAFAQAAIGRYYSHDADCTASIAWGGDGLVVVHTDPYGRFEGAVRPLSTSVAHVESISTPHPMHAVLTLMQGNGRVTGFALNTVFTRNLAFTRVASEAVTHAA